MTDATGTQATQTARRGRKPRAEPRRNVTIVLSDAVLEALYAVTSNRSAFIEAWLRQQPDIAAVLAAAQKEPQA